MFTGVHYLELNAKRAARSRWRKRTSHLEDTMSTNQSGLPSFGEILSLSPEDGNENDAYAVAVAVMKDRIVVGHAPRELSRVFSFFIRHDGSISAEVTGHRKYGCGLEVPCRYTLQGKPKYIKRAKKLLLLTSRKSTLTDTQS